MRYLHRYLDVVRGIKKRTSWRQVVALGLYREDPIDMFLGLKRWRQQVEQSRTNECWITEYILRTIVPFVTHFDTRVDVETCLPHQ